MPEHDCGICDKLINCSGSLNSKESFQTLVAKLLCEGIDSFAELAEEISAIGDFAAAIAALEAAVIANTAAILANTGDIATNTGDIAMNTGDIATNVGDISALDGRVTTLEGASVSAFNWTTSEQTWPFETYLGNTLYAKIVNLGTMPNNTTKNVAHGITSVSHGFVVRVIAREGAESYPYPNARITAHRYMAYMNSVNVVVATNANASAQTGYAYLIYSKS